MKKRYKLLNIIVLSFLLLQGCSSKQGELKTQKPTISKEEIKQHDLERLTFNLQKKKRKITKRLAEVKSKNIIRRYSVEKELAFEANRLHSDIFKIEKLDANFDKVPTLEFIKNVHNQYIGAYQKLKFYVDGNKKSTKFIDSIKHSLRKEGFNVSASKQNSVYINIQTNSHIKREDAKKIAVLIVDINLFESAKHIDSNFIVIKERYRGSNEEVYVNAKKQLEKLIEKKRIDAILGIYLNLD